jgi:tetratricopeptide (TPR) repeat protein
LKDKKEISLIFDVSFFVVVKQSAGLDHLTAGRFEQALQNFDKVLESEPNNTFAAVHRAITLHFTEGRRAEADAVWPELVKKINKEPALAGLAYFHAGIATLYIKVARARCQI